MGNWFVREETRKDIFRQVLSQIPEEKKYDWSATDYVIDHTLGCMWNKLPRSSYVGMKVQPYMVSPYIPKEFRSHFGL